MLLMEPAELTVEVGHDFHADHLTRAGGAFGRLGRGGGAPRLSDASTGAGGVETTGQVVAKLESRPQRRHRTPTRRIHYSYADAAGNTHENRSLVTDSF